MSPTSSLATRFRMMVTLTQVRLHALQSTVRVEWKKVEKEVRKEYESQGFSGRFGPGLPRVSDGSLLFLLHLSLQDASAQDGGSRFGIVLNGSPLFTGGAGSGESEIRRYLLENDLVEALIGLTDRYVLQHRHLHLCLDCLQPQASPAQGPDTAHRCLNVLAEDA
jgi:type I restriction-modification system DNA methylase subunit